MAQSPSHPRRQTFGGELLSELLMLGYDRFTRAELQLVPHRHEGWEICYLVDGTVDWWASDGVHEVRRGDLYVTRPGEIHGGLDAMMHPCELYWLILRLPDKGNLPGLIDHQSQRVCSALKGMALRSFPGSARVVHYFEDLMSEHRSPGCLSETSARAALHGLLVSVIQDHEREHASRTSRAQSIHPAVRRALDRIDRDVTDDWQVEALARGAGLGVSRFHELFVEQVGLSPSEYRALARLRLAKRLLRGTSRDITDIAFDTGFASSQYFATCFRKYTGLTPRQYRTNTTRSVQPRFTGVDW